MVHLCFAAAAAPVWDRNCFFYCTFCQNASCESEEFDCVKRCHKAWQDWGKHDHALWVAPASWHFPAAITYDTLLVPRRVKNQYKEITDQHRVSVSFLLSEAQMWLPVLANKRLFHGDSTTEAILKTWCVSRPKRPTTRQLAHTLLTNLTPFSPSLSTLRQ
jgi:hypothetical protein